MNNTTQSFNVGSYRFDPEAHLLLPPAAENNSPEVAPGRPGETSSFWQFLLELRQRKVCRAALMYALAMWLVCQVGEVVFKALNFPEWALPLVVVAGVLGFPIALILAWTFEVTPTGLALDIPVTNRESRTRVTRDSRWNFALLAASVLISLQMLLSGFGAIDPTNDKLERLQNAESIVVTPFQATSVSLETKAYAFVLSEEIRHLLHTEYQMDVISADGLTNLTDMQKRADLLLQGSVTIARGETQIMVHLVDPADGYDLWSEMIFIPDIGTANSQHQAARRMLRALPIGNANPDDKPGPLVAKAD